MGNKNCGELEEQYLQNQAYGEYQIVQENWIKYAKIVKVIQSKSGYQKAIETSLMKRKQMKSDGLCELHYFQFQPRQSIIQIVLKYQYIPCPLFQKRQLLFSKKIYFSLEQLMKIIDTVSMTLYELYNMKIKHGCINFNTILCTENGYKLTDVSTTTNLNSIQLVQRGSMDQPISTKLLNLINQSERNPTVIKTYITLEDDLFSLGIIILSLAARVQVSQFYHFSKKQQRIHIQYKEGVVDDYLYLLRMRYSKKIQTIVRKFLFPAKQYQQPSCSKAVGYKDKTLGETHPSSYFSINIEEPF